ncbi:MAG: hypothetical protein AB7G54_00515 [Methyloceanibacter sp.]
MNILDLPRDASLYSCRHPRDPAPQLPRGCLDAQIPYSHGPRRPAAYGSRTWGLAGFEETLAADQKRFAWRGSPVLGGPLFSAALIRFVRARRSGDFEAAEKHKLVAEDYANQAIQEDSGALFEVQRLTTDALNLVDSFNEADSKQAALDIDIRQAELNQSAAEGSTKEAWDIELEDRADLQRAEEHGAWTYGLSYLPGGDVVAEGVIEAKSFIQNPWVQLGALVALGLGAVYVGRRVVGL